MADTEFSNLDLMGGDMAGIKTTMSATELEESNVVCRED